MSISGRQVLHYTVLDAKAATGVGVTIPVRDFRNCVIAIGTASSANLTVKCKGAVALANSDYTAPDFSAAQTVANNWSYVQMVDLNDGTPVTGSTGFVAAGTDAFKLYEVNVNGLDFITLDVTARSAGSVTATAQLSTNV